MVYVNLIEIAQEILIGKQDLIQVNRMVVPIIVTFTNRVVGEKGKQIGLDLSNGLTVARLENNAVLAKTVAMDDAKIEV